MEFEWSTYTDYISRFGLDLANDLLGMDSSKSAQQFNQELDCSSPDVSWGTGHNHFGGDDGL